MLRTWTDTHYKLDDEDWMYAIHEEQGSTSLVCPGYARDGEGFSIHLTPAHTEILENLIATLQIIKAHQQTLYTYQEPKSKTHLIRSFNFHFSEKEYSSMDLKLFSDS